MATEHYVQNVFLLRDELLAYCILRTITVCEKWQMNILCKMYFAKFYSFPDFFKLKLSK
jgi:hypothetical protein